MTEPQLFGCCNLKLKYCPCYAAYNATISFNLVTVKKLCQQQKMYLPLLLGHCNLKQKYCSCYAAYSATVITLFYLTKSSACDSPCTCLGSLGIVTLSRKIQLVVVLLPIVPRSVTVLSLPKQCLWWYLYLLWLLGHCNLKQN